MKEYRSTDIRNFALAGHGASGKTILGEAMLACGGVIGRMGSIDSGNTVSDYHIEERINIIYCYLFLKRKSLIF